MTLLKANALDFSSLDDDVACGFHIAAMLLSGIYVNPDLSPAKRFCQNREDVSFMNNSILTDAFITCALLGDLAVMQPISKLGLDIEALSLT
ncbi:MAG: hypothetical protein EOO77_16010 [Oxalobacteraceae bacterium]|nr:MAG: hypothetical protein EOO77_16010 [Oxalobacteraceae bacterium]